MIFKKGEIEGAGARKTFQWKDADKGENVMYRIPRNIRWNDNVVVREDEYAVFFRDGKVMHVFDRPGRFAMTTLNVPILAKLGEALTGIKQLGEIYYVQRRELRGKFGTPEPLVFRDKDFGLVRLRVFGKFSYKIVDPTMFITQFVGTEGVSTSDEVIDWAKSQLVLCVNDTLGELKRDKKMGVVDMPAYLEEIEQIALSKVEDDTTRYGIKIMKIADLNINLPEEVQEAVDKRGAMGALGVDYMGYQTGKAIEGIGEGAAKGGNASSFAGMGAGFGAGMGMADAMAKGMTRPEEPKKPMIKCPKCNADVNADAKFCPNCGKKMVKSGMTSCPKCNAMIGEAAKFCPECGVKLRIKCKKCNEEVAFGTKFCPTCGTEL